RPDQLSGGQCQRVAIARATITRPDMLLADEPTGNLDSVSGTEVIQLMETMNKSGLTVLVVTHDPAVGDRARRKIKMIDGAIVADTSKRAYENT
ncbi:MAG: ATP-binding cassette domain-containing protein, partial [Gammaproteobacteria bacterium]|nr:ATP-binding cassette domain-containing protein [Gammaproteobacteria bacterium]